MKHYHLATLPMLFVAMASSNATAQTAPLASVSTPVSAPVLATPATVEIPTEQQSQSPMMSPDELDEMRGGTQIAINNQLLNAENTGNNINGDFTAGDVNLSDNAFSTFNGLGNFVFNTGAQSSLQAGMSVTININD